MFLEARNAFLHDLPFSLAQLLGLSTLLSKCITQAELTHVQFHVLSLHGALFVKGNAFPKESNVLRLCLLSLSLSMLSVDVNSEKYITV